MLQSKNTCQEIIEVMSNKFSQNAKNIANWLPVQLSNRIIFILHVFNFISKYTYIDNSRNWGTILNDQFDRCRLNAAEQRIYGSVT